MKYTKEEFEKRIEMAMDRLTPLYRELELIDFANYVLARYQTNPKINQVTHADIENWKHEETNS